MIEMCGWKGGTPVLHPIAYADPREPGAAVVAPGWLVRAALAGARAAGAPLGVGDPYLSWLYQPAVRTFRVRLYGDDLSFLQAGRPALFASDSSFSAFYPDYHQARRRGRAARRRARSGAWAAAALGVVRALDRVPRGPAEQPHWFAAFGRVVDWPWLLGLGALSLLPGLRAGYAGGSAALRRAAAGRQPRFGVLLWRHPVPALWVFLAPHLLLPFARRWWAVALALAAARRAARAIGFAAWWRGAVNGVWLAPVAARCRGGDPGARPSSGSGAACRARPGGARPKRRPPRPAQVPGTAPARSR